MRIIDYCVADACSSIDLKMAVQALIMMGWEPFGSMVVKPPSTDYDLWFYQPMVQYDRTAEK